MKKQILNTILSLSFALAAGSAMADSVGPYYATPSWDQTLPATTRFVVLSNFSSEAFLDRNTGLVWPTHPAIKISTPKVVENLCTYASFGGQLGWRLPTINELTTLYRVTSIDAVLGPVLAIDVPSSILTIDPSSNVVSSTPNSTDPRYRKSIYYNSIAQETWIGNTDESFDTPIPMLCVRAR